MSVVPSCHWAVMMLIGPQPEEIERARDTVASLLAYEPTGGLLLLVDDCRTPRPLAEQIAPSLAAGRRVVSLLNPRLGRANGWGPGTGAGALGALREACKVPDLRFVLKLDTDALVVAPFVAQVNGKFAACPQAGILGTYQFSPAQRTEATSTPALEKLLRQFTIWRRTPAGGPALQLAFWGKYKRVRNVLRQAIMNGYRLGEHCAGGSYAISMPCVRALQAAGLLDDPTRFLQVPLGDDPLLALLAAAAGYGLAPFDAAGEPFAIRHRGLPDTPENLLARGHSIIHSVKDHGDQTEVALRAFFRNRRDGAPAPSQDRWGENPAG